MGLDRQHNETARATRPAPQETVQLRSSYILGYICYISLGYISAISRTAQETVRLQEDRTYPQLAFTVCMYRRSGYYLINVRQPR